MEGRLLEGASWAHAAGVTPIVAILDEVEVYELEHVIACVWEDVKTVVMVGDENQRVDHGFALYTRAPWISREPTSLPFTPNLDVDGTEAEKMHLEPVTLKKPGKAPAHRVAGSTITDRLHH